MIKCNITIAIKQDCERKKERAWGFYQGLEIIKMLRETERGEQICICLVDQKKAALRLLARGGGDKVLSRCWRRKKRKYSTSSNNMLISLKIADAMILKSWNISGQLFAFTFWPVHQRNSNVKMSDFLEFQKEFQCLTCIPWGFRVGNCGRGMWVRSSEGRKKKKNQASSKLCQLSRKYWHSFNL